MIDDAFIALQAIDRGQIETLSDFESWIGAFKTIKWVAGGETGFYLTAAGREAFDQMKRERLGRALGAAFTADEAFTRP